MNSQTSDQNLKKNIGTPDITEEEEILLLVTSMTQKPKGNNEDITTNTNAQKTRYDQQRKSVINRPEYFLSYVAYPEPPTL